MTNAANQYIFADIFYPEERIFFLDLRGYFLQATGNIFDLYLL